MPADKKQLLLIDGSGMLYRAFHAPMADLNARCSWCEGGEASPFCRFCNGLGREPTKATWLFTKQLIAMIGIDRPDYLAIVFDGPKSIEKRRKIWFGYKKDRTLPPFAYRRQVERTCEIVQRLGYFVHRCGEYEADDALATLATQFADQAEPTILTRDKDLRQLCVDPRILVRDPMTKEYFSTRNAGDKWGIETRQITDYLVLTGDSCDGIPGVGGIGPKTATDLLQRFHHLEGITAAANYGGIKPAQRKKIIAAAESRWLDTSRRLITLDSELNLGVTLEQMRCGKPNLDAARPIFRILKFKEWM